MHALITLSAFAAVIVFAWRAGGEPEREGAVVLAAMLILSLAGHAVLRVRFLDVDPVSLAVDLVGFVGFLAIAFAARRFWPIWACSLQLLSSGAHFARQVLPPMDAFAYAMMRTGPTDVVLLVLAAATWMARQRRLNGWPDRPWRKPWRQSARPAGRNAGRS